MPKENVFLPSVAMMQVWFERRHEYAIRLYHSRPTEQRLFEQAVEKSLGRPLFLIFQASHAAAIDALSAKASPEAVARQASIRFLHAAIEYANRRSVERLNVEKRPGPDDAEQTNELIHVLQWAGNSLAETLPADHDT